MSSLPQKLCSVEGCNRKLLAKNMCAMHYRRVKKHGTPGSSQSVRWSLAPEAKGAYWSWRAMKERCLNPKNNRYYLYGGRGITITEEWLDFLGFYRDMGNRPEGTTLDRENPDGNYEPGNCRWLPSNRQSYNRRWESEKIRSRGVFKRGKRYRSAISKDGIRYWIGTFDTSDEAAWMYDQYAVALYEDDAHLNFEYLPMDLHHL